MNLQSPILPLYASMPFESSRLPPRGEVPTLHQDLNPNPRFQTQVLSQSESWSRHLLNTQRPHPCLQIAQVGNTLDFRVPRLCCQAEMLV